LKDAEYSMPCKLKNGFMTYGGIGGVGVTVEYIVPTKIVYGSTTIYPDFKRSRVYSGAQSLIDTGGIHARTTTEVLNGYLPKGYTGWTTTIALTNSTSTGNTILTTPDPTGCVVKMKKLETEYEDSMGIHSLSFNSKAATSSDYFNAADEYFSDLFNYIYSANSIYLTGTVYLNREQCMSILRNNVIFNIDGEEYIPISIENVPINDDNGGLVDVNLIKKQ
jgi:hypothetical protein